MRKRVQLISQCANREKKKKYRKQSPCSTIDSTKCIRCPNVKRKMCNFIHFPMARRRRRWRRRPQATWKMVFLLRPSHRSFLLLHSIETAVRFEWNHKIEIKTSIIEIVFLPLFFVHFDEAVFISFHLCDQCDSRNVIAKFLLFVSFLVFFLHFYGVNRVTNNSATAWTKQGSRNVVHGIRHSNCVWKLFACKHFKVFHVWQAV